MKMSYKIQKSSDNVVTITKLQINDQVTFGDLTFIPCNFYLPTYTYLLQCIVCVVDHELQNNQNLNY